MQGGGRRPPGPSSALAQYRWRAAHYDLELAPFEPLRRAAIAWLDLHPGQSVLDVGCGTGLSFAGCEQGIGSGGAIVGIEPSPEMLELARSRVARHGWRNVELLQASAGEARLRRQVDAALFHFTHDVLRDADALAHLVAHLKPGAAVVATGLQWAPPWMLPANAFVLGAALYSVSTLEGLDRPWGLLARHLRAVQVRTAAFGGIYIAKGLRK